MRPLRSPEEPKSEPRPPPPHPLCSYVIDRLVAMVSVTGQVLDELAKRETAIASEGMRQEEAASLIQSLIRRRRTRHSFAMLMKLAKAARVVSRGMRAWANRRYRKAALCVQAHLRSYVCQSRGICRASTILLIIYGTRASHVRAMARLYQARETYRQLLAAKRAAERTLTRAETRKRAAEEAKAAKASRRGRRAGRASKESADGVGGGSSDKAATASAAARPPGRFRLGTMALGARGQNLVNGLLPRGALPRPQAISSRIPLFPTRPTQNRALTLSPQNKAAAALAAPPAAAPAEQLPTIRRASMHGSSPHDFERRRSAAAAAKAVLTLSALEGGDSAAGAVPRGPQLPSEAGSSKDRAAYNAFSALHGGGGPGGSPGDPSQRTPPGAGGSGKACAAGSGSYGVLPTASVGSRPNTGLRLPAPGSQRYLAVPTGTAPAPARDAGECSSPLPLAAQGGAAGVRSPATLSKVRLST